MPNSTDVLQLGQFVHLDRFVFDSSPVSIAANVRPIVGHHPFIRTLEPLIAQIHLLEIGGLGSVSSVADGKETKVSRQVSAPKENESVNVNYVNEQDSNDRTGSKKGSKRFSSPEGLKQRSMSSGKKAPAVERDPSAAEKLGKRSASHVPSKCVVVFFDFHLQNQTMTIKAMNGHKKNKNLSRKWKKDAVSVEVSDEKVPLLLKNAEKSTTADQEFSGASFSGAVFNLSTTIIGAGIMALPATMNVLGLVLGIALIVFVGILTEFSVGMLLRFSKAGGAVSYGGVMGDAFGNVGRRISEVCVVINNIGVLIVYMIIIGDVLSGTSSNGIQHSGLVEGWFGEHWWNGRAIVLLVTTLVVLAPLSCFKRMDSLRYTSALAVFLAFVFLVITVYIAVFKLVKGTIGMPRLFPDITDINSVWRLFTVVPVLVTSYVCHFNVHSIENELEDSSRIRSVVQTSLALCSIVYIMTSFFGFLLFGDATLDDVLANFDSNLGIPYSSLLNDTVRVSYIVHLMLVFPIIFHPLRLNLDGLLFPSSDPLVTDNYRFALITVGLLSVVFLGANFIPSIWDAFQFTGATSAVCIGFIFPAAIALRDAHGIATKKDKILAVFMIGLAVFTNLMAIYSDAYTIFKRNASPRE
ncbi:Transmembrane amino acid transporter family protein [Abeliophyllum distichum]|uniref:Transmembrane amino acid transporter family protein n=1 Tax=Abeliophyllum distichum TaxID=126358 RepID=A0ABD1U2I5_9LAMI